MFFLYIIFILYYIFGILYFSYIYFYNKKFLYIPDTNYFINTDNDDDDEILDK